MCNGSSGGSGGDSGQLDINDQPVELTPELTYKGWELVNAP
jgi:hypothetical protein